jgi:hypothetical protein
MRTQWHAHIVTRGSMKAAHNLDRRDDFLLKTQRENGPVESIDPELAHKVTRKFQNLGWLYCRESSK